MRTAYWMLALAVLGMLFSAYGLQLHYDGGESVCNVNDRFNCDTVNKSSWSMFLGIPVALLGLLAYAAVFLLVLKREAVMETLAFTGRDFWLYLSLLVTLMFAFQLYLTLAEVFFIKAYCIVCLGSQAAILGLLVLSWRRVAKK